MKTLSKFKTGIIICFLIAISATTSAHGPEEHISKGLCVDDQLKFWLKDSGPCDPNNPPNLTSGITHQQYPNGLCYPTFNNFTDAVDKVTGYGLDPYGTIPPLFGDERNFFKAAKVTPGVPEPFTSFNDEVTIDDGDTVQFYMYIHNDGDPCLNDNINLPQGKFYSNWKTTSHNTKFNIEPNFSVTNSDATIKISQPTDFNAAIWSDDAITANGVKGGKIKNSVKIIPKNNKELTLEYSANSAEFIDMRNDKGFEWDFYRHDISSPLPIFSSTGFQLSTLSDIAGNIKGSGGDYYASEPYVALVKFTLKAKAPTPNICTALTLKPLELVNKGLAEGLTGKTNIGQMYKITTNNLTFANGTIPANTNLRWTTTDPNGKFWAFLPNVRGLSQVGNTYETKANANNDEIFYTGTGTVNVTLSNIAPELANPSVCRASVQIPVAECKDLYVNHKEILYTDTVSEFSSYAFDTGANPFPGKITYTVSPGYGKFYLSKPTGDINPSTFISEYYPSTASLNIIDPKDKLDAKGAVNASIGIKNLLFNDVLLPGDLTRNPFGTEIIDPIPFTATPTQNQNGLETVTVDPGTVVYFIAEREGTNVVTVRAANASGNVCLRTFDTTKKPTVEPICKDLKVNYNKPIYTDVLSKFNAKAVDLQGNTFNGKITYSVAPGNGFFMLNKPSYLKENTSQFITEFTPSILIPPVGGFCSSVLNQEVLTPIIPQKGPQIVDQAQPGIVQIDTQIPSVNDLKIPGTTLMNLSTQQVTGLTTELVINNKFDFNKLEKPRNFDTGIGLMSVLNVKKIKQESILDALKPEFDFSNSAIRQLIMPPAIYNQFHVVTVDPGTTVYFYGTKAGKNIVRVETNCTKEKKCIREFDVEPLPVEKNICKDLKFKSTPASPLSIGQEAKFEVAPIDNNGNPLPGYSRINISTTAGGEFIDNTNTKVGTPQVSQFPVTFRNSTQNGQVTLELIPSDKAYSPVCRAVVEVKTTALVCQDLTTTVKKLVTREVVTKLEPKNLYEVSANANYSQPTNNTITYNIDPQVGRFVNVSTELPSPIQIILQVIDLDKATVESLLSTSLVTTIERANNVPVTLIVFSDAPNVAIPDALKVNATNFFNVECTAKVPYIPPTQQLVCESLDLAPLGGDFNPKESTLFRITGNFVNHTGEITVTTNYGKLYKVGQSGNAASTITFSNAEVRASNNNLSVVYIPDANLEDQEVTVRATAVGAETKCSDVVSSKPSQKECIDLEIIEPDQPWEIDKNDDNQTVKISVNTTPSTYKNDLYYNWEISGDGEWDENNDDFLSSKGDFTQTINNFSDNTEIEVYASVDKNGTKINACKDTIRANEEETEKPTIKKLVYPTNDLENADNIINIKEKRSTKYVTYMVVFRPGNDTKSAEIWDSKLENGRIKGNLGGSLEDFNSMQISVIDGNKSYAILRTEDYEKDRYNSSNYSDSKLKDDNNNDLEDFEKDFKCDKSKICIEGDFDAAVEDFKDGEAIKFKNVDKLGSDAAIIIKYQMKNNSKIDASSCKNLKGISGCGEEFNNRAEFKSYKDEDFQKETFRDFSKAKVIVICPFILSRQGGDVFFSDLIETGVDVAECAPVKSTDRPVIKPKKPKDLDIVKTGDGETGDLQLLLPSHDVCSFSNTNSSNIEEYSNVLKNFSSTICEMEAEVAEQWQEQNIKDAISANIKKLSRFGTNVTDRNLSSPADLASATNQEKGVFMIEGGKNLIIGGNGDYIIEKSGSIPAAQTYIVKGGNLIIKSNIKYGQTDYSNPKNIPSAAFIVIDGNIQIEADVDHIDGILMAVDLDGLNNDGRVISDETENLLTINGNLIGNVIELFSNRLGVGDPRKDEASVTIRYDERIILNTPPGISELVDLKQAIIPN